MLKSEIQEHKVENFPQIWPCVTIISFAHPLSSVYNPEQNLGPDRASKRTRIIDETVLPRKLRRTTEESTGRWCGDLNPIRFEHYRRFSIQKLRDRIFGDERKRCLKDKRAGTSLTFPAFRDGSTSHHCLESFNLV